MELAEAANVRQPIISDALENLGPRGTRSGPSTGPRLVTRVADTKDARLKPAALTPKGGQLVTLMRRALAVR